jgi:hypothetical protein
MIFTYDPLPGEQKQRQRPRQYRLSGGEKFTVMQEMEVGRQVLLPRVRDGEKFLELSERGGGERERMLERLGEFLYFDVEEIEEEILEEEILEEEILEEEILEEEILEEEIFEEEILEEEILAASV